MKVFIEFYMREKNNSNSYELFMSEETHVNEFNIQNIDLTRMMIIDYFKVREIELDEYKVQVYEKDNMKIVNIYFDHDKSIDRGLKLDKILKYGK